MIIASRYNGPPGTGNGGYSAGTFVVESFLRTEIARAPSAAAPRAECWPWGELLEALLTVADSRCRR